MAEINTKSNKSEREIAVEEPEVLTVTSLDDAVAILGADMALGKIKAQLKVDFRSHIRSLLESETDGEPTNSDEDIQGMDFDDWKPTGRVRLSAEEKAAKVLGSLDADQLKAVLAQLEA